MTCPNCKRLEEEILQLRAEKKSIFKRLLGLRVFIKEAKEAKEEPKE